MLYQRRKENKEGKKSSSTGKIPFGKKETLVNQLRNKEEDNKGGEDLESSDF